MTLGNVTTRRRLLACAAVVGLVVGWMVYHWLGAHGYDVREVVERGLAYIRRVGPVTFFALMTIIPAIGAPLTVFTFTAGSVFSPVLGLPLVLFFAFLSIGINLVFTYALARWFFRPWIERLCAWFGYRIPVVSVSDQRGLVALVRVTPGPPYALQNYLFGIGQIRFPIYFTISWVLVSLDASAYIVFGDAVAHGKGRMALIAVSLFVVLTVSVRFMRRRLLWRKMEGGGINPGNCPKRPGA
jgi:uncharacterized membrane protein YdjX (TVP38/TMEM64 family)